MRLIFPVFSLLFLLHISASWSSFAEDFTVQTVETSDLKPVAAEVRSAHRAIARTRVSGTISEIKVAEGDKVKQGDVLAIVNDPKQPLAVEAVDARLKSLEQERKQAASDVERYVPLVKIGAISQMKMDELNTRLVSLTQTVKAARAERDSAITHKGEGKVLAPMSGQVLSLPVPIGNVVMAGETVAELTAGDLLLKIRVPEISAKYLKNGKKIRIVSSNENGEDANTNGVVKKIYPEVEGGFVTADLEVSDLSHLFVGERMTAYVPTASRKAIYVPRNLITRKHGLNYVTLKSGGETVVELGLDDENGVEILSGLSGGDILVSP